MSTLPKQYRKTSVMKLSADFREATEIITVNTPAAEQLKAGTVLVKNIWVGINASDINFTNGKYLPGVRPPFDAGFEAVGVVVASSSNGGGKSVQNGTTVVYSLFGAFAEYTVVPVKMLTPFAGVAPKPELMPLLVSGLTASIGLEEAGEMKTVGGSEKKKVVLVTAAAGATGLFAVQLASLAGHHVIGTCSSDDKAAELKKLGCHRVVNYKKEELGDVLKKEYKKGVDIVYECVGGEMYDACVRNLARFGKLIVIGFIAGYADGSGWKGSKKSAGNIDVKPLILGKSASIRGFFLEDYRHKFAEHLQRLNKMIQDGKLQVVVDKTPFKGLEAIPDAIDHLYKGGNTGKVVVKIADAQQASKL